MTAGQRQLSLLVDHPSQWKRFREDIAPILQDRGLVRTEYDSATPTLRGNLGLPVPGNRYTKARAADESLLKS